MDYLTNGCTEDLLGDTGFTYSIRQILRLEEGGLAYFGMPCNSFTWLSSPQHQRTTGNPFGSGHFSWVHAGNILVCRMALLICICVARNVKFMIEQPDRSSLRIFPYLQHVMSFPQVLPQRIFWSGPWITLLQNLCNIKLNIKPMGLYLKASILLSTAIYRYMGSFGAWSEKPQMGLGNWPLDEY